MTKKLFTLYRPSRSPYLRYRTYTYEGLRVESRAGKHVDFKEAEDYCYSLYEKNELVPKKDRTLRSVLAALLPDELEGHRSHSSISVPINMLSAFERYKHYDVFSVTLSTIDGMGSRYAACVSDACAGGELVEKSIPIIRGLLEIVFHECIHRKWVGVTEWPEIPVVEIPGYAKNEYAFAELQQLLSLETIDSVWDGNHRFWAVTSLAVLFGTSPEGLTQRSRFTQVSGTGNHLFDLTAARQGIRQLLTLSGDISGSLGADYAPALQEALCRIGISHAEQQYRFGRVGKHTQLIDQKSLNHFCDIREAQGCAQEILEMRYMRLLAGGIPRCGE